MMIAGTAIVIPFVRVLYRMGDRRQIRLCILFRTTVDYCLVLSRKNNSSATSCTSTKSL